MKRYFTTCTALTALVVVLLSACTEKNPTASVDEFLGELNPRTVEVVLPFEEFTEGAQVLGGYGTVATMGRGVLANDFQGLNSRVLLRFGTYPDSVRVFDPTTGIATFDKAHSIIGGRLVLFFDTIQGVNAGPADVVTAAIQQSWDVRTANWDAAVDTAGQRTEWVQPGGGVTAPLGSGVFDRQFGRPESDTLPFNDSLSIAMDSAQIAAWADPTDASRGVLVSLDDPGRRIVLEGARLRLIIQPSLALAAGEAEPDTLIEESAFGGESTFIYDPLPGPPTEGLRVGGAPSWRTVLSLDVPRVLTGPAEVCAVLSCPFDLAGSDAQLGLAELVLTTRETLRAHALFDSLAVDLRTVVSPELLPKSPLGGQLAGSFGVLVQPNMFAEAAGAKVTFPITFLVNDLMFGDSLRLASTPTNIVFLSVIEPPSLGFASFHGPGSPDAPSLRLLLTVAGRLTLP